jgi:hypothetical protein
VTPEMQEAYETLLGLSTRNNEVVGRVFWLCVGLVTGVTATLVLKVVIYTRVITALRRIDGAVDQCRQLLSMTRGYAEDAAKDRHDAAGAVAAVARLVSDSGPLPKVAPPAPPEG